jgi:hypothetical protein
MQLSVDTRTCITTFFFAGHTRLSFEALLTGWDHPVVLYITSTLVHSATTSSPSALLVLAQ